MPLIDVTLLGQKHCLKPIQAELKYAGSDNFVGRPLKGYHPEAADIALMTPTAAKQLCQAQNYLVKNYHYGLIIYDAYRPRRAVVDLLTWTRQQTASKKEQQQKEIHYPHIQKQQLFPLGYICEDSGHCYGNTVDVFLLDLAAQQVLDMGACYDYMDELSHLTITANEIGEKAYQHRTILLEAMEKAGFESYPTEFWHYSHDGIKGRESLHPFDIEITPKLRGLTITR